VRGLITLGPALAGQTFAAPDNVHLVPSAPHAQIIPRARIVVTHCGHGTTLKALSHGTPLLCLPMGRDQVDNAARTVWHGAGIRLKRSASVPEITRSLETLLGNDRYATQARALAERLRREGERDRAVEELEALAVKRV
jgi:UDP:flavonoid glycosyltransferase YjiC (YdhE family)